MKNTFLLFIGLLIPFMGSAQTEVAGVKVPETINYGGEELILNGAGVREKFWMDMYAGALYLNKKNNDATAILNANDPKAIKLHIVSSLITSEKMIEAVNEGFESSTRGNTAPMRDKIDQFKSFFNDKIEKNDVFDIVYLPQQGVNVYKNGNKVGNIKGNKFAKALFGIWLSAKPADDDLKEAMLGE